jgi:molybdopterin biosynthesis enzyme MoaB
VTTVKDTRAGLRHYKPDTEIIVAWWDKAWFETALNRKLTADEWDIIQTEADDVLEYCDLGDQLQDAAARALQNMNGDAA